MFIEFRNRLFPLKGGDNLLGSGPLANIRIPDVRPEHQIGISVDTLGAFAWAVGDTAVVTINGRRLDGEPTPLFNGDRLSLNGCTLIFIEDGGEATVRLNRAQLPKPPRREAAQERAPGAVQAAAVLEPTEVEEYPKREIVGVLRGRQDSHAYIVGRTGFRIGREKRCDLLIPDRAISRLHAEITFSRGQYLLRDLGRTATKVNGKRLREPYKLQVGDVIQIGKYEFEFLRRPATAEELAAAEEITPVRSRVPDAPTLIGGPKGGRGFVWLLLLAAAAFIAWMILRSGAP